jgi:uncharacterized OB-fold protein
MARVRESAGGIKLIGSRCAACGHVTFPARGRCPACRSEDVSEALLGPGARVQRAVELYVSTDESEAPYTLGYVSLDDGPTVLARVVGTADAGTRVALVGETDADVFHFTSENGAGAPA